MPTRVEFLFPPQSQRVPLRQPEHLRSHQKIDTHGSTGHACHRGCNSRLGSVSQRQGCGEVLPSKICTWKTKDNSSLLRLDVKGIWDDAVCACEDWLEAIEAMNKLKFERMKVRTIKVSHEKLKESLVDTGVHGALASFLAHDMSLANHAKPEDHLGSWSSFMFGVTCLGFFVGVLVDGAFVAVLRRSSQNISLTDGTVPAPHTFGIERDAVQNESLVGV